MRRIHFTHAAEKDLEEIARCTREPSGEQQGELYLDALEMACERLLVESPGPGSEVGVFRRGRCWHHVIYFRLVKGGIELVRVLHERMLPDNPL